MRKIANKIKKWLYCSWAHYRDRCYPKVWIANSKKWHCTKCHPCSDALKVLK